MDIDRCQHILARFRRNMEEIRGVLEAMLDDELADFDPEEFKRMEKLAKE